jgi:asparagine synthase (glutamine-hydrolysing)
MRTIYLIANGEIYNYKKLMEEENLVNYIKKINYVFKSNSDCEVLLVLFLMTICEDSYKYDEKLFDKGLEEMLLKLNGEFAFAIYDIHTNLDLNKNYYNLWLSRDRFGIRPLFYSQLEDSTINFGSELKSLNNINDNKVEVLDPRTWYHWGGILNSDKFETHKKLYWAVGMLPMVIKPDPTDVHRMIRTLLIESVKLRLQSDREIGCLLSGGLDSSLIASIAARELAIEGKKLKTFSIGMEGSPDVYFAKIVANHIGSIHTNIEIPSQELIDSLPEVIRIAETFDITTIRASVGQYLLGKYINENSHVKVILNGDGADEIEMGYLYFYLAPTKEQLDRMKYIKKKYSKI